MDKVGSDHILKKVHLATSYIELHRQHQRQQLESLPTEENNFQRSDID